MSVYIAYILLTYFNLLAVRSILHQLCLLHGQRQRHSVVT